jgi:hypothetical protein
MNRPLAHTISRRALAAGAALAGGAVSFRRPARSQEAAAASPEATPAAERPALLLRFEAIGGNVTPEMKLIAMPEFSLYDDGSMYRLGPVIAIFPPPALPNVTRMRIAPDGVTAIMERARAAGLDQPRNVPNPMEQEGIASIRIRFNDDGQVIDSTTFGLFTDIGLDVDWDASTRAAFKAMGDLLTYLVNLPAELPAHALLEPEIPVDPERLQIVSFEAMPDSVLPSVGPDLNQPPLTWPLSTPLAEISSPYEPGADAGLSDPVCVELSAADVESVVATAREGNLMSPWIDGDATYGLLLKPLLPDMAGCAPLDAS